MFGLETLDVLIGLVTIYLAFAVACTAVVEVMSGWLGLRANNLYAALSELLKGDIAEGQSFVDAFYAHPLIETLSKGDGGRPSYLPPELVGRVVEAMVVSAAGQRDAARVEQALAALPDRARLAGGLDQPNRVKQLLSDLLREAEHARGDVSDSFRTAVSRHFDATMQRASGWFKRQVQLVTLLAAAVLVFVNNVDTVAIATALSSSREGRTELVRLAEQRLVLARERQSAVAPVSGAGAREPAPAVLGREGPAGSADGDAAEPVNAALERTQHAAEDLRQAVRSLDAAGIPLGWRRESMPHGVAQWLTKVAGLLVTVFAVMLGAPFWFGVLEKLNAVRATGKVPVTVDAEASTSPDRDE